MKQALSSSVLALGLALGAVVVPALEAAPPPPVGTVETLLLFDPLLLETPESIVFDRSDNAYISLAFRGEIRKVAPDYSSATPLGGVSAPAKQRLRRHREIGAEPMADGSIESPMRWRAAVSRR